MKLTELEYSSQHQNARVCGDINTPVSPNLLRSISTVVFIRYKEGILPWSQKLAK